MENKIIRIANSDYKKMTDAEIEELKLEYGTSEIEVIPDADLSEAVNKEQLTYFNLPIELEEKEILKNKHFKEGLNEGYKLGGVLTGMINSGFSREVAESYAMESALIDKKLEISKLEQENKSLENDLNSL